jgi:hypothetical protein
MEVDETKLISKSPPVDLFWHFSNLECMLDFAEMSYDVSTYPVSDTLFK